MPYNKILFALICGAHFYATDENGQPFPQDDHFARTLKAKGLDFILQNVCGFDPIDHPDVFILSENYNIEVNTRFKIKNY